MSKYIPPHLRRKMEEEEKAKIIVPLSEEAKNAPPPSKWNFREALLKNDKEFNIPKKKTTNNFINYDYSCIKCSAPVKREGLNDNGTNYCWFCHSKILFKNAREYNDDDDYYQNKTESQILKELYTNYLYNDENNFDY